MRYKSIVFCSADPTKNAGNLSGYFQEESEFFTVFHFFPGYVKKKTYIIQYRNGKKIAEKSLSLKFSKNVVLKNFADYIFFCYMLIFLVPRGSFLITNAPIYCAFNSFFKITKSIKYILRIDDYYPDRSLIIRLYNLYVDYLNKSLPYVIYISPPLSKIYSKRRAGHKFKKLISLGIKPNFSKNRKLISNNITLGFIGIIRQQQGIDLIFEYLRKAENVKFEIVGTGYYEDYYKKLADKFGIDKKVKFYGIVENVKPIFSKWDIGLALYVNSRKNLSKYCEPTKLKDYLSHGIPVITTKTTYLCKEILDKQAGEVIEETPRSLGEGVKKIVENYNVYISGVKEINKKYFYKKWYDEKFDFLAKKL